MHCNAVRSFSKLSCSASKSFTKHSLVHHVFPVTLYFDQTNMTLQRSNRKSVMFQIFWGLQFYRDITVRFLKDYQLEIHHILKPISCHWSFYIPWKYQGTKRFLSSEDIEWDQWHDRFRKFCMEELLRLCFVSTFLNIKISKLFLALSKRIICDALRDLIPVVQFKKREKRSWWSATFSKIAGFSFTIPKNCFILQLC